VPDEDCRARLADPVVEPGARAHEQPHSWRGHGPRFALVFHGGARSHDDNVYPQLPPWGPLSDHFPQWLARLAARSEEKEQREAPLAFARSLGHSGKAISPPRARRASVARRGTRFCSGSQSIVESKGRVLRIGVLGGTGPAGTAIAVRYAAAGFEVVVGSRSEERAAGVVDELQQRWKGRGLALFPGTNQAAASAELVVLATPWEGATATVKDLAGELSGKIVVSMVNAMAKWAERFIPLLPPTGSVALAVARAIPDSRVAGAFHHLPAGVLADLDEKLEADVMVFSDTRATTDEVIELVNRVPGLRGVDVGGMASALAVEALTAALVEVNRRYKTHASLRVTGLG